MSPGYVITNLGDKGPKYREMRKKHEHIFEMMDEMFNLANDWTSLDTIWDKLCFQFKEIDSGMMLNIVKDLTEAGIIESRSV
jgi:hypothetical protein